MTTTKHICYTVHCDRCGKGCNSGGGMDFDEVHWQSEGEAIDRAQDADWVDVEGKLYCDECAEVVPGGLCSRCLEPKEDHPIIGSGWRPECLEYQDPTLVTA